MPSIPKLMKAAVIDRYGGPEVLHVSTIPVPEPKADEVLIRLAAAGVGVWDAEVRAGEWEIGERRFPKVIGSDGAGEDGEPGTDAFDRLSELISKEPFHVEVRFYPMAEAAQAHRDLPKHHLGKLALRMG
jgi:NADPH:quinone reductase-like Zn-dependent oxidoreductase